MSWYGPPSEPPGEQSRPSDGPPALPGPGAAGYDASGYNAPGYGAGYGAAGYNAPAYSVSGQGVPGYGTPMYAGPVYGPPPENNLVWAILCTVLCCWPLGIPSIIFANQVNTKWMMGDAAGAHEAARKAKQFAVWGAIAHLVLIVVVILIYVGFFALIHGLAASSSTGGTDGSGT
jgi:hypothetical protein